MFIWYFKSFIHPADDRGHIIINQQHKYFNTRKETIFPYHLVKQCWTDFKKGFHARWRSTVWTVKKKSVIGFQFQKAQLQSYSWWSHFWTKRGRLVCVLDWVISDQIDYLLAVIGYLLKLFFINDLKKIYNLEHRPSLWAAALIKAKAEMMICTKLWKNRSSTTEWKCYLLWFQIKNNIPFIAHAASFKLQCKNRHFWTFNRRQVYNRMKNSNILSKKIFFPYIYNGNA